jgi:hypothetical protein
MEAGAAIAAPASILLLDAGVISSLSADWQAKREI